MEFNFSINALFKEKIIKVKSNLLPDNHVPDRHGDGDVVSKISILLDKMGVDSAKAQNLPRTITSASKLKSSNHVVYFLADPKGNKGHGTVVGLLKVGPKKLFVYDKAGNQMEMEPLCVLDFYVHESKQRTGCGRTLFDFMLQDQQVSPQHLALDQPSESFLSFMNKHYQLDTMMPQNNGFVVYESFFSDRSANENVRGPRVSKNVKINPVKTVKSTSRGGHDLPIYGRHSAKKAESTMSQYMQDSGPHQVNGKSSSTSSSTNNAEPSNRSAGSGEPATRPTTLPEKLNGLSISSPPPTEPDELLTSSTDAGDGVPSDAHTPEKLDLKFYHSRLCSADLPAWHLNQHRVPLTQYGHYWSTVGQLLEQPEDDDADGILDDSAQNRHRKVSNIPIGNEASEEDIDAEMDFIPNGLNGNGLNTTTRDVRFKKTKFQNLSPFRK